MERRAGGGASGTGKPVGSVGTASNGAGKCVGWLATGLTVVCICIGFTVLCICTWGWVWFCVQSEGPEA
eukprot:9579372-Alexandrium_andersonii.AAC.1